MSDPGNRPSAWICVPIGIGLVAFVVGTHDLIVSPSRYGIFGVLLGVAGLVALIGGLGAVTASVDGAPARWQSRVPALSAASSLAALGIVAYMFLTAAFSHAQGWSYVWRFSLWLLAMGGVVVALVRLNRALRSSLSDLRRFLFEREFRLERKRLGKLVRVQLPAAVVLLSVAGAAWQWSMSEEKFLDITPALSVQGELKRGPLSGGMIPVTGAIRIRNTGDAKVAVVGSIYRVVAVKLNPPTKSKSEDKIGDAQYQSAAWAFTGGVVARNGLEETANVIQAGRVFSVGWMLERGEEYQKSFVLYVPQQDLALLRLEIEVATLKSDVVYWDSSATATKVSIDPKDGGPVAGLRLSVSEPSWIRLLTRPGRQIEDRWGWIDGSPQILPCEYVEGEVDCQPLPLFSSSTQVELSLSKD